MPVTADFLDKNGLVPLKQNIFERERISVSKSAFSAFAAFREEGADVRCFK